MIQEAVKETQFWFVSLVNILYESIREGANLVFRIIFDSGGFGTAFKEVLVAVCNFINMLMVIWNNTGCVILREVISPIVGFLIDILDAIIRLFAPDSSQIISLLRDVQDTISNMDCNMSVPCHAPKQTPYDEQDGALPVATRCWADYVPGVDDTDALSCTRSDTCRASYGPGSGISTEEFGSIVASTGSDQELLCYSCPIQMGGYINRFGCDTITKQCTCNRPKRERTHCTANEQCLIQVPPHPFVVMLWALL
jgi:hypothetical protein